MLKNTLDYRMVRKNRKFIDEDKKVINSKNMDIDAVRKVKIRKRERVRVRKK